MKNNFLNFKSLILIITLAFTINFFNISANADSNIPDHSELLYATNNVKNDINAFKKSSGDSLIPTRSQLMWVTDNADVLSDSDIKHVITKNEEFSKASNVEISVLTIENLPEGYDIEAYAYKVFDEWGMNSKEKNNGVLMLIVSGENKTFIATGSGLKSTLMASPEYSFIEKNFATSLNTHSNKYNIRYVVSDLATNINTIYKNASKKSSGDSLIPQRSQLIWVTDNADVLHDSSIKSVITQNEKFAKTSNAEISVLTIESLPEGYDIETYAYKVFDEWGMNSKEKNNGVLLLIVSGENKAFIATGSGLKSALTTSLGYNSIEESFTTSLSTYNNKYMIGSVVSRLATNINTIDKNNSYNTSTTKVPYIRYLIIFLIIVFTLRYLLKRASKSSSCKNSMKKATVKITSSAKEPTSSTDETISSGDKAVDVIISEGLAYLRQIKQANHAITNKKITVHITRMEVATDKIFRYIAKHPEDAPQIRKFMNYYLPTLLKLLDSYISLNEQGIKGEHISSTIENIEGILSTIADAFEKQLDNLFADDALDISTDIKVLENMLAQEGLTSDGFKK
ncbi:5-bromo-4-chloroindolyl phosphate hydrolysis family protein [Clostridium sp. UBA1056]|uniref:5-bromo-4-chloroindolyl phosphate hydrolysis family protein n=1 Tax=unclassified Clostridium TaxID=2614128 RepID=UPI0032178706